MLRFLPVFLCLWSFVGLAGPYQVIREKDSVVVFNDHGKTLPKEQRETLTLVGESWRIRKTFDLTSLPADIRPEEVNSAAVRLHLQVLDQSANVYKREPNGVTEEFRLIFNGKHIINLKLSDSRISSERKWVEIPFPAEYLAEGMLTVEVEKVKSEFNDDFLYLSYDPTAEGGGTDFSVNGGQSWHKTSRHFSQKPGELFCRLVLSKASPEIAFDFTEAIPPGVQLHGGARHQDGALYFDGSVGSAELLNTATLSPQHNGLTATAVVKFASKATSGNDMLLFYKPESWMLAFTNSKCNFSYCSVGGTTLWDRAMFSGEPPSAGEWVHVACVFEYVDETAQGQVGYKLRTYLNGVCVADKFFYYDEINGSSGNILLGHANSSAVGEHLFKGWIASVKVVKRTLSQDELLDDMKQSPLVKVVLPGQVEVDDGLRARFEKYSTANGEMRFVAESLLNYAQAGGDTEKLVRNFDKFGGFFAGAASGKQLRDDFNALQTDFRLLGNDRALLMVVNGQGGTESPVVGMYDMSSQASVFSVRPLDWQIVTSAEILNSYDSSASFTVNDITEDEDGRSSFQIAWDVPGKFRIVSQCSLVGGRFEQSCEVENLSPTQLLRQVEFPLYTFARLPGKKDSLTFPLFIGVERHNPTQGYSEDGLYPSARASMQFVNYYDDQGNGIYAGYEAIDGAVKTLHAVGKNKTLQYSWSNPVAFNPAKGGNHFRAEGKGVIELYRGGWFEGGEIYKRFLETRRPQWYVTELPRTDTPVKYRDNPFLMVLIGRQTGSAEYLRNYLGLPFYLWYPWWETIKRDINAPEVVPKDWNAPSIKKLNELGIGISPYMNFRVLGFGSTAEEYFELKDSPYVKEGAFVQENGQYQKENYGHDFHVMCAAAPKWHELLEHNIDIIYNLGARGAYLDQLPCGGPRLCFNPSHGHALNDPLAWSRGYVSLLKKLQAKYPDMSFDGEDNSEVYASVLDGFVIWRASEPDHIPQFHQIYGGGRVQLLGRAFNCSQTGSYGSALAKLGEQLVWGEQIGWIHINEFRYGTPLRIMVKRMSHLRSALVEYYNASNMLPPIQYAKGPEMLTSVWGSTHGRLNTAPAVQACAWQRIADGRIVVAFVNASEKTQDIEPVVDYPGYPCLLRFTEGHEPEEITLAGRSTRHLTLPLMAAEVWLLGQDFQAPARDKLATVMKQLPTFTDTGKSLPRHPPTFSECKKLVAEPGKWFYVNDASWRLFAQAEETTTLGYQPGRKDEIGGNWCLARPDAIVSFGEVEFKTPPKALELRIAVSPEYAGGLIEFWDVTGDYTGLPDRCFASYRTEKTSDGFFDFKTIRVPVTENIVGKRLIIVKFKDNCCCFRGWRPLAE